MCTDLVRFLLGFSKLNCLIFLKLQKYPFNCVFLMDAELTRRDLWKHDASPCLSWCGRPRNRLVGKCFLKKAQKIWPFCVFMLFFPKNRTISFRETQNSKRTRDMRKQIPPISAGFCFPVNICFRSLLLSFNLGFHPQVDRSMSFIKGSSGQRNNRGSIPRNVSILGGHLISQAVLLGL